MLRETRTQKISLSECPCQYSYTSPGYLSTLIEWHEQDPVDERERNRTDQICRLYQGNRNPFVDMPSLVERVFGTSSTSSSSSSCPSCEETIVHGDTQCHSDPRLYISTYYEGAGYNKLVEIWNPTNRTFHMATGDFQLSLCPNGCNSPPAYDSSYSFEARRRKKEKQAWATLSVNDRPLSRSKPSSSTKREQKQWPQDRTSRLKEARRILKEEKQRREKEKLERGWQGRAGGSDYRSSHSQSRRDPHDQDTKTTTLPPLNNDNNSGLRIQRPPTAGSALTDMSSVFDRTLDSRMSAKSVAFESEMDVSTRAAHDAADAVLSPSKSPDRTSRRKKKRDSKKGRAKNFSRRLDNSPLKTR